MSLQVHQLRPDELPRIRKLGRRFADEVKLFTGYVPEFHEQIWRPLMEAGMGDVFFTEDESGELTGFLGASYVPDLYSGAPAAQSQFWYVAPEVRHTSVGVRLFNAFEAEAKRRNTKKYFVGHKIGINEEAMRGFFLRRGYRPGEIMFWKHIN